MSQSLGVKVPSVNSINADYFLVHTDFYNRFSRIRSALEKDISENKNILTDLYAWSRGDKTPENIPLIASRMPNNTLLAQSVPVSHFLGLEKEILHPLIQDIPLVTPAVAVTPVAEPVVAPHNAPTFSFENPNTTTLTRTRGLYVTQGAVTQRLINYSDNVSPQTKIHTYDDDRDGDQDVFYNS